MIDFKKIPSGKAMKGQWSQNVQLWLRNGLKLAGNHPAELCIVGEIAGGGSMAVAAGVSDM